MNDKVRLWRENLQARKNTSSRLTDEVAWGTGQRYTDPLIIDRMHNKTMAWIREVVCESDPLANRLTGIFSEEAFTEMIKLFPSKDLLAPEILPEIRQFLVEFNCDLIFMEALDKFMEHGWVIGVPAMSEKGLECKLYSEFEIPPERLERDPMDRKQIIGYHIDQRKPELGLGRSPGTALIEAAYYERQEVIHATRGPWNFGLGHSKMEGLWDAITKLREQSHGDYFRRSVRPKAIFPPDWSDSEIDDFIRKLANADNMGIFATRAATDNEGNPVPELPAISWGADGEPARATSSSGNAQFGDLSSEWARLCAGSHHTVRYFVGDPGGAQSAGQTDYGQDYQRDIMDFNLFCRSFIVPFIKWLMMQMGLEYPTGLVVKGYWEYARDEFLGQQMQMMMFDQQMQAENNQQQKQNTALEMLRLNVFDPAQFQQYIKTAEQMKSPQAQGKYLRAMGMPKGKGTTMEQHLMNLKQRHGIWPSPTGGKGELSSSEMFMGRAGLGKSPLVEAGKAAPELTQGQKGLTPIQAGIQGARMGQIESELKEEEEGEEFELGDDGGDNGDPNDPTLGGGAEGNYEPNKWYPVNSASGHVQEVMYTSGENGTYPSIHIKFDDGEYTYQDPQNLSEENILPTMTSIAQEGGEAVWKELRGLPYPGANPPGEAPKGWSKTSPSVETPYAGKAHLVDYTRGAGGSSKKTGGKITPEKPSGGGEQPSKFAGRAGGLPNQEERAMASYLGISPHQQGRTPTQGHAGFGSGIGKSLKMMGMPKLAKVADWATKNESLEDVSRKRFNEIAQTVVGHTFGGETIDMFKKLMAEERGRQQAGIRYNSSVLGKTMDFDTPLRYENDSGGIDVEYACKKAWKRDVVGKKATVQLYHMNGKYPVGTVEFGWNEEKDEPFEKAEIDREKALAIMKKNGWTTRKLYKILQDSSMPIPVSTEYMTDPVKHNGKSYQSKFVGINLALVDEGNCPHDVCNLHEEL